MISGGERLLQKLFLFIQLTFGVKIKVKNYHINYLKPCYIHCLLRPTLFFLSFALIIRGPAPYSGFFLTLPASADQPKKQILDLFNPF